MLQAASYISSSAENLYKFLFINGTILVILSMFYPLKEKQEIDINVVGHNRDVELLNSEIFYLEKDILDFSKESKQILIVLDSISKNRNSNSAVLITDIKSKYNKKIDSIQALKRDIELNVIRINSEKDKIQTLQNQALTYKKYSFYFLVAGSIFFIVGVIGWSRATLVLDKIKDEELRRITEENNRSSFTSE